MLTVFSSKRQYASGLKLDKQSQSYVMCNKTYFGKKSEQVLSSKDIFLLVYFEITGQKLILTVCSKLKKNF